MVCTILTLTEYSTFSCITKYEIKLRMTSVLGAGPGEMVRTILALMKYSTLPDIDKCGSSTKHRHSGCHGQYRTSFQSQFKSISQRGSNFSNQ